MALSRSNLRVLRIARCGITTSGSRSSRVNGFSLAGERDRPGRTARRLAERNSSAIQQAGVRRDAEHGGRDARAPQQQWAQSLSYLALLFLCLAAQACVGPPKLADAITPASATVKGQFYTTNFRLKNGETMAGSLVENVEGKFRIAPSIMAPDSIIELNDSDIVAHEPSLVSPMPAGLMNPFTQDQFIDLIAFLLSGGNPQASVFAK